MLSAIRVAICIAMFFMSWTIMIGMVLYGTAILAKGFGLWIAPLWNTAVVSVIASVPAWSKISLLIYHAHAHTALAQAGVISAASGGVIVLLQIAWLWVSSIERDVIRAAKGIPVSRIDPDSDIGIAVTGLAGKVGIKSPRMYLVHSSGINAFAIRKPLRSAIAVYSGTLSLPPGCRLWIIGHEMGHIKYGDTFPSMLRIATIAAARWFSMVRLRMIGLIFPILVRLPVFRLLVLPLELFLIVLFYCTAIVHRVAVFAFSVIDKTVLRSIEYRADAFASTLVPAQHGIQVMNILEMNEEKTTLMQDHPPASKRAVRMTAALLKLQ